MIHKCSILKKKRQQTLTFSNGIGTPQVGQTVTGGLSGVTAIVTAVGVAVINVKDLSGTFTPGETITTESFMAAFGTAADAKKAGSSEYAIYWTTDQEDVACRFYQKKSGRGIVIVMPGTRVDQPLKCALPASVHITPGTANNYQVITSEPLYAGTYAITAFYPFGAAYAGVDHFEAELAPEGAPA